MTVVSELPETTGRLTTMSVDTFIRAVAVNRGRPLCLLLGAGASISSGMPSAQRCIWEWKRDIFVTKNPTLRESFGELSLPGTRQRIQRWLDQRGSYPAADSPEEYSFYARECYPTGQFRRSFFQSYVAQAKPHTGYKLLPILVKAGLIRTVWTTNFDGLVGRACAAADVVCVEVGIDTAHRAARRHVEGELRVISMHGDYRYDDLKNTEEELQQQEAALHTEFLHELGDYDLVVAGYSGRDVSLMAILHQVYAQSSPCCLYWCGFGEVPSEPAEALLRNAGGAGRVAFYVPSDGFDDLVSRLALRQLDGVLLADAKKILAAAAEPASRPMAFSAPPLSPTSLVKSNAYPLGFPSQALILDLAFPEDTDRRTWLDKCLPTKEGLTVAMDNGALALSSSSDVQLAFGSALRGIPVTVALSEEDVARDGRIRSLLRRALIQSVAKQLQSDTDGSRRIWEPQHYIVQVLQGIGYQLHRALSFHLMTLENKLHVVLMPEVIAKAPDGQFADRDSSKVLRNAVYGYQHNNVFDADLKHWTSKVTNLDVEAPGGGTFRISNVPIYAGLFQKGKNPLPQAMQRHARQSGVVVSDANLIFSSTNGRAEVKNTNPLKGLVENRPWDFQLTSSGLSSSIDIAVVCPQTDSAKLKRFLTQFQEKSQPKSSERDYLHDFPGFSSAFGLPLTYPNPGEASWFNLDDGVAGDPLSAAKQLAQRICRALDVLRSLRPSSVATIFIPTRWTPFKIVDTETEIFNLHDYVKAYAARQGQSTQFIREETTVTPQPCRVRWWLSLALYAKALRTPWRLDCLDDKTAFVGIGYSIDHGATRGRHVLLGCSHLYSARGEGLQFRLGRIENPIIRGRNPFMSEDDARRTGETIRQLFFDAKMCLPQRVVVHKRTPFTMDEQRGLVQGLEGVANVELIEVNVEESLRYLASKFFDGKLDIDKFPVPRGAVIVQNENTALLWVHGAAPSANNPNFKYYQGKRRIPAPLLIRRYLGQSDVVQVATEILGLSKMNWNTFDYYSRLPATLDSASAIAKVGTYLSGFGSAPYDYRLLI
ncbi:MAG: nuclease [Herminiimonas sp.]|nr:nuclease [Herminiimonas sp.]